MTIPMTKRGELEYVNFKREGLSCGGDGIGEEAAKRQRKLEGSRFYWL
jgi:hypothetical protein